jgi:ligand-binding sensor domain-containing protein
MRRFLYPKHRLLLFAERIRKIIRPPILLCLIFYSVSALAAQYKFETWTTEQDLPYKIVNSVLQTGDGYVWAATDDGLARFDGVRFTVFNTANTKNLMTNRVHNLVETSDGSLWMAGENRGLIRYRNGEFRNYTTADGLPDDGMLLVFVSSQNSLRVVTKKGAARFDGEKFVHENVGSVPFDDKNPPLIDNAGALWVNEGDKLRRFGGGEEQTFSLPKTVSIRHHIRPYQDSAGNFWVAADHFVLRFADGKTDVFSLKDGLPADFVIAIFEDSHGNVWFGSQIGGLSFYKDGKFKLLTEKDGLISQNINHIAEDREGGIWVGTDGGLMRLSPQIIRAFSTADGLTGDNVYPLMEEAGGAVWIGSWLGEGLVQIRKR